MDTKISNGHLVILKQTGYTTEAQISEVIRDALEKGNLYSDFYVNVVTNKWKMCKYAYVWVTDTKAFEYLVSYENKGFVSIEKTKIVDNSNYVPKALTKSTDEMTEAELLDLVCDDTDDWCDSGNTISTIKETTKIHLKPIRYTQEQIDKFSIEDPDHSFEDVILPFEKAVFEDLRSANSDSESESGLPPVHNVWYINKVPDFITSDILLKYLRPYATDPTAKGPIVINKKKRMIPYPHINIRINGSNQNRNAFVTFNPNSNDGQFALYMCRQLKVEENGQKAILYCNHHIPRYQK